jgi:hypothetical protein
LTSQLGGFISAFLNTGIKNCFAESKLCTRLFFREASFASAVLFFRRKDFKNPSLISAVCQGQFCASAVLQNNSAVL